MSKTLLGKVISRATENQRALVHAMENKGLNHYYCLEKKEATLQEPSQPFPGDAFATKQQTQVAWHRSVPRFWALVWDCSVVQLEQEQHTMSRDVQILLTQEATEQTTRCRAIKPRLFSKNAVTGCKQLWKTSYSNVESCPWTWRQSFLQKTLLTL